MIAPAELTPGVALPRVEIEEGDLLSLIFDDGD